MEKPISLIVAIDENYGIGKNNQLLVHLPEDMKRFKRITDGHVIVMGRKTFLSLPKRPLPGRKNVVLTTSPQNIKDECVAVSTIEDALSHCNSDQENFIIGGDSVYRQFIELAQKLYITKIHNTFEADTFFPAIDMNAWKIVESESHKADEKHKFDYTFVTYLRK